MRIWHFLAPMRLISICLLFTIILFIPALSACTIRFPAAKQRQPSNYPADLKNPAGFRMATDATEYDTKTDKFNFTIFNDTEHEAIFGAPFVFEIEQNDTWYMLSYKDVKPGTEMTWPAIANILPAHGTSQGAVNLTYLDGIEPGNYRLIKEVTLTQSGSEKILVVAYFKINEGEQGKTTTLASKQETTIPSQLNPFSDIDAKSLYINRLHNQFYIDDEQILTKLVQEISRLPVDINQAFAGQVPTLAGASSYGARFHGVEIQSNRKFMIFTEGFTDLDNLVTYKQSKVLGYFNELIPRANDDKTYPSSWILGTPLNDVLSINEVIIGKGQSIEPKREAISYLENMKWSCSEVHEEHEPADLTNYIVLNIEYKSEEKNEANKRQKIYLNLERKSIQIGQFTFISLESDEKSDFEELLKHIR